MLVFAPNRSFQLSLMFSGKARSYPRGEQLKGASHGLAPVTKKKVLMHWPLVQFSKLFSLP
jgi:hypothetical protein